MCRALQAVPLVLVALVAPFLAKTDVSMAGPFASATDGSARAARPAADPALDPADFGAFGNGAAHTVGSILGRGIRTPALLAAYADRTGAHPYTFAGSPIYGLVFSLADNVAQTAAGSTIAYPIPGTNTATVATGPSYNYVAQGEVVLPGMVAAGTGISPDDTVTSVCTALPLGIKSDTGQPTAGILVPMPFTGGLVVSEGVSGIGIPNGATIASVGEKSIMLDARHPTTMAIPAGTMIHGTGCASVTLAFATTSALAAGTTIIYSYSAPMLQALDMDWLGTEAALAAAAMRPFGGRVSIAAGRAWQMTRTLVVPPITNPNGTAPQVELIGDGRYASRLRFASDLGFGSCGIAESNRSQSSVSRGSYRDLDLVGPGNARFSPGFNPAGMDGFCLGEKAAASRLTATQFHAGINLMRDHQTIDHYLAGVNYFGIELAANSDTYGGQTFTDSGVGASLLAGVGVAWNNTIQSVPFRGFSTGFGPYGFYREGAPSGRVVSLPFVNDSLFEIYGESLGNGLFYGENAADTLQTSLFNNTSPTLDGTGAYKLASRPANALIDVATQFENTFIGSDFASAGNYALVSDAIFEASSNIQSSRWMDTLSCFNLIAGATAAKPALLSPTIAYDDWREDRASGVFANADTVVAAGEVVARGLYHGGNHVTPETAALIPFGIAMTPNAAGHDNNGIVVATAGQVTALKTTDAGVIIATQQPVALSLVRPSYVTSVPNSDFMPVIGVQSDVGGITTQPANTTVVITLDPYAALAARHVPVTGLASAGSTLATATPLRAATDILTDCTSGGFRLTDIPIGQTQALKNRSGMTCGVYPPTAGEQIEALGNGAMQRIENGADLTLTKVTATQWYR